MLKSMTGFGRAVYENEKIRILVEIKSVNSKALDLQLRLPIFFKEKEIELRQLISNRLSRGKIDYSIDFEDKALPVKTVINETVAKEYIRQFQNIAKTINYNFLEFDIFQTLVKMPDILKTDDKSINPEEWNEILNTCNLAITETDKFREQEGKVLEQDFIDRIEIIETKLLEIPKYESQRIATIRNRLKNSSEENKDLTIDKNRFEQEIIYYIEKLDITEEKIRLANHCKYFKDTIAHETEVGKKLVFISQEIGREINTLGSKANNYEIQKLVVEMKDELEKIKEQLLNVI